MKFLFALSILIIAEAAPQQLYGLPDPQGLPDVRHAESSNPDPSLGSPVAQQQSQQLVPSSAPLSASLGSSIVQQQSQQFVPSSASVSVSGISQGNPDFRNPENSNLDTSFGSQIVQQQPQQFVPSGVPLSALSELDASVPNGQVQTVQSIQTISDSSEQFSQASIEANQQGFVGAPQISSNEFTQSFNPQFSENSIQHNESPVLQSPATEQASFTRDSSLDSTLAGTTEEDCPEGQVRHLDGRCVAPEVTRRVFVYAAPENTRFANIDPAEIPTPKVEHNIVFIRTDELQSANDPIIVPPPQRKHIIYVLNKGSQIGGQRVIQVTTPKPKQPEVYFVNYAEGETPTLPDGTDFETALNSAIQSEGQFISRPDNFEDVSVGNVAQSASIARNGDSASGFEVPSFSSTETNTNEDFSISSGSNGFVSNIDDSSAGVVFSSGNEFSSNVAGTAVDTVIPSTNNVADVPSNGAIATTTFTQGNTASNFNDNAPGLASLGETSASNSYSPNNIASSTFNTNIPQGNFVVAVSSTNGNTANRFVQTTGSAVNGNNFSNFNSGAVASNAVATPNGNAASQFAQTTGSAANNNFSNFNAGGVASNTVATSNGNAASRFAQTTGSIANGNNFSNYNAGGVASNTVATANGNAANRFAQTTGNTGNGNNFSNYNGGGVASNTVSTSSNNPGLSSARNPASNGFSQGAVSFNSASRASPAAGPEPLQQLYNTP